MDFELSSSSSSDEGQWSPSSSPIHQEMDATDRLSHSNKKRSLDHSSDDDDDPEGGASDNESVDDHRNIDAPIDSSSLLLLSTAKSSRTRRVVGLAMSRLSELERIKQGRKFTPEESREYKKLKRQRQNRDAAANSRKKKKQKLDSLEVLVNGFKRQNDELIAKLTEALKENQSLKEALEAFKKQANGDAFHSTATISVKEGPSSSTLSSPPSSSPSVCSSSAVSSISEHSVPTVGRMESFINHSVESADGMMNDVSINLPPPPSVPISMTNNETVDNNDEGNIEGLETSIGYQFVSVVGGLFQSIDSSTVDDNLSPTDDVILSNPSSDLSSCAGNEIFDPSNTLPLFRCSSLSTISKEFSVISDNASLDSFYGFAPLSSAFQSAF